MTQVSYARFIETTTAGERNSETKEIEKRAN